MKFSRLSLGIMGSAVAALVLFASWHMFGAKSDPPSQVVLRVAPTETAESTAIAPDSEDLEVVYREKTTPAVRRSFAEELIVARRQAEGGDAVAMRRIGEIYDDCHNSVFIGPSYVPDMKARVAAMPLSPLEKVRAVELAAALQEQCAEVEGGKPYPQELIELSYREAALRGDLAARVIVDGLDGKLLGENQADALAEQALREKNSAAMLELFRFMPPDTSLSIRGVDGGRVSVAALAAFGCELDPSRCGPASRMVTNFCVYTFQCNANSVPDLINRYYVNEALRQAIPEELRRLRR